MTNITGKISLVLLSLLFLLLSLYLFNNIVEFSEIFPFKRILLGNTLKGKIDIAECSVKFGTRIIKIEGEDANAGNTIDLLTKYKIKNELNITLDSEGQAINKTIIKINNNRDYILFLSLFMLFGVIHYIWGCVAYLYRPDEMRSKLFLYFSITLSSLYYTVIILFTSGENELFILAVLAMGFMNIFLGAYLTNQKIGRTTLAVIFISATVIIIYSAADIIMHQILNPAAYVLLFIYFAFCSSYTLFKLIYGFVKNNYSFIKWRYSVLLIVLFIGNSIPVLNLLLFLFSDLSFPVCIVSGLTLLSPLIAGNAFLRYNQYDFSGFKIFRVIDFKLLFYDLFVSVLSAILIYSLLAISTFSYQNILYAFTVVFMLMLLLNSQHFLLRRLKNYGYENKDKYAFSTHKIAELCSSSGTVKNKLKNVYQEISELSGTIAVKLVLFLDAKDEYYLTLGKYMEVLPKNSDLYYLINLNNGIILKYALIRNSVLEERVYDFLEKRNFILAIPLLELSDIKGVLLVGERASKGFYSDADIHYFQTVVYQILQLIESDRLFKDYSLKKQYEKELDNASYVQLRLFPKATLKRDRGIDISFFYRPYLRVIGDYFDFFKIDGDRTAIVIGDVSGHGLSTAMVLSAVNSITHAMLREQTNFERTFIEINNYLNKSYRGIELITLFIGIFNRKTKAMEYINAGHGAPLLIRKQKRKIRRIEGRSKILGADPDAVYLPSSINLARNDELILYTDGVMEIYNENTGAGLNEERLIKIISENLEKDLDGKIIEIEKNVKIHSKDIKDDITIIGVKVH